MKNMDDQPNTLCLRIKEFTVTALLLIGLFDADAVQSIDLRHSDELFNMVPVSEIELDNNRGGFVTRNGVRVDFGFEKSTFVNGVNQFRRSINFNSQTAVSTRNRTFALETAGLQQASVLPATINTVNNFSANQLIQEITTLNIRISNIGIVQRSGLGSFGFGNLPQGVN